MVLVDNGVLLLDWRDRSRVMEIYLLEVSLLWFLFLIVFKMMVFTRLCRGEIVSMPFLFILRIIIHERTCSLVGLLLYISNITKVPVILYLVLSLLFILLNLASHRL